MSLGNLGQGAATDVKNFFEQPADKYGNDATIEIQWAIKAYHHAEVYFSLIKTADPALLKLTPMDSEIYSHFREAFSELHVDRINEDAMKSVEGKVKWREFCEQYKGRVEDYNMGTLLRIDSSEDISDSNTTLVPRIQFLAVEIARNREGFNAGLRKKYGVASKSEDINKNCETKDTKPESS